MGGFVKSQLPLAVLALALFAVPGTQAQEFRQPAGVWLTPEVFSLGGSLGTPYYDGNTFRFASLDLTYGRLRLGTSLVEGGYSSRSEVAMLPFRVGYVLWQQPHRYLRRVYGMTPEVCLQATAAPWQPWAGGLPHDRFAGHTEALFNMNIYGIGFEVGAGAEVLNQPEYPLIRLDWNEYSVGPYRWVVNPLVEMRVGLGVASIRL